MNKVILLGVSCALAAPQFVSAVEVSPTLDNLIGENTRAVEIIGGDGNKAGLAVSSGGLVISPATGILDTKMHVLGFYNGNFDVDFTYTGGLNNVGVFSVNQGVYQARDVKPDGTPGDYVGKQMTLSLSLKAATKLGDMYFNVTDNEVLKGILSAVALGSASRTPNNYGGWDLTHSVGAPIPKDLTQAIIDAIKGDSQVTDAVISAMIENVDFSFGALMLNISDPVTEENIETAAAKTVINLDNYTISTYESNADVIDRYNRKNDRAYRAMVEMDPVVGGRFSILNFSNTGYTLKKDIVTTESTDETTGEVTSVTTPVINRGLVTGTIDFDKGVFTLDEKQTLYTDLTLYNKLTSGFGDKVIIDGNLYAATTGFLGVQPNYLKPVVGGTVEIVPERYVHGSGTNNWHKNVAGGEFERTVQGSTVLNFTTPYLAHYLLVNSPMVENTRISFPYESSCTHDVSILWGLVALSKEGNLHVGVNILPAEEHADNVEGYDIVLRHGNVDKIVSSGLFGKNYHAETGINDGLVLDSPSYVSNPYMAAPASDDASEDNIIPFRFVIPVADLPNNNTKPLFGSKKDIAAGDDINVYVRTRYNDGSAPTFHALTAAQIQGDAVTGIGSIEVGETDAHAVYYNLNGVEMSRSELTPGVYLCRRGNEVTKVVIK